MCTLTRMKSAPVAVAMASAAEASFRRTATPVGTSDIRTISRVTPATVAVVSAGTVPGWKGASLKFSTIRASTPCLRKISASEIADS